MPVMIFGSVGVYPRKNYAHKGLHYPQIFAEVIDWKVNYG